MGEVSSMPSSLTMEHFLLANRDLLDKDEERAWIICASHRWRDECDLLTPMGVKDTLPHCSTKRALRTVEGARHQAVVVARGAGLLLLYRYRSMWCFLRQICSTYELYKRKDRII